MRAYLHSSATLQLYKCYTISIWKNIRETHYKKIHKNEIEKANFNGCVAIFFYSFDIFFLLGSTRSFVFAVNVL